MPLPMPTSRQMSMASVEYYVIQSRLDKRYIAGRNVPGDPYRMVPDIDRALRCLNEADAEGHIRAYVLHCRSDGRRIVPSKSVYVIIPVEKKPLGKTWWERL